MAEGRIDQDLADGLALERAMRWAEAEALYARTFAKLPSSSGSDAKARVAHLLVRRGNVLMELGRWDDARRTLDDALSVAKDSSDLGAIAEALLAAGVYAANRGDAKRSEAFLLDALERYHRRDDRPFVGGRGRAFLNLAGLYGKTGRLDLAFVTFTKAQDVLGAAKDWAGVAAAWEGQALLRRAIGDEDRWREDLAEAVVFYDREGMAEKASQLRALLGRKLV
jgi:tetratricopeptide (TPR) repeat protein